MAARKKWPAWSLGWRGRKRASLPEPCTQLTADLEPERYLYTREYQLLKLLRERRTAAKVSQAELALRLHWTQAEVSKCETGVRRLDVTEMKLWLDALGTSLVYFVGKLQDE